MPRSGRNLGRLRPSQLLERGFRRVQGQATPFVPAHLLLTNSQKYHSIAAKGGKVEPPLVPSKDGLVNGDKHANATADEQAQDEAADSDEYDPSVGLASKSGQESAVSSSAAAAALPQALAANGKCNKDDLCPSKAGERNAKKVLLTGRIVHDDAMKNIMMSWYYAGYYTGLYEGKQIGYASAFQQQPGHPQQPERG